MTFTIAFFNCGGRNPDWDAVAATVNAAVGPEPHIVGLCEIYDPGLVPEIVAVLSRATGKQYHPVLSDANPPGPRLAILADASLGRLQRIGDDEDYRHGREHRHWLAGRVEFHHPGTRRPSRRHLVVVANHWNSMKSGRRDSMGHREILAWEVGRWMCSHDTDHQAVLDEHGRALPVYRQPCVVMGDFNCEPGALELRSFRKFTLQAMRNEPVHWDPSAYEQGTKAMMYDLSWRRLAAAPGLELPGTYNWNDTHSPEMLDRILVSHELWRGPGIRTLTDGEGHAMRIVPAVGNCSDHSAVAITVEIFEGE
jgi:endonuclease/exonuclease/phosphatase family metal-dependent hydrolase